MRCALLLVLAACWSSSAATPSKVEERPRAEIRDEPYHEPTAALPASDPPHDAHVVVAELKRLHQPQHVTTSFSTFITSDVVVVDAATQVVQTMSAQQALQASIRWHPTNASMLTCGIGGSHRFSCVSSNGATWIALDYCHALSPSRFRLVRVVVDQGQVKAGTSQWLRSANLPQPQC